MRRGLRLAAAAACALPLGACQGIQNVLGGDGVEGRQFVTLFIIFMVVVTIMYLLVIGFLGFALVCCRRTSETNVVETGDHHKSHPLTRTLLIGWGALISVGLVALAIASFFTDRSMAQPVGKEKFLIELTGNQWWWNVRYDAPQASKTLRTANEIHLPVGVPVRIKLQSNDVIHSFWVPNLAGKQDLIPGRVTDITIVPAKIGTYRAQCAEYCGVQHAHMALTVTVESKADFQRWWSQQLTPAAPPRTPLALAGYQYVTTRQCVMCHSISGTPANATVGPDLTHLASRPTIAAGTLPMSEGNLYGWIADPQSQKPGTKMPTMNLEPNELHAIVAYLKGLK
jgi:cytochrome c oxidase subunit 2